MLTWKDQQDTRNRGREKAAWRVWGEGNILQKGGGERTRFSLPHSEKWRMGEES